MVIRETDPCHNNYWLEIFYLLIETVKAAGFKSLPENYWKINPVTPKFQMDFFNKICKERSKAETVNIAINIYILEIV